MSMASETPAIARFSRALPFCLSLLLIPIVWIGAVFGGWAILLVPLSTWATYSLVDAVAGLDLENPDTDTPEDALFWYRAITMIWAPVQFVTVFAVIAYVTTSGHLVWWEILGVAFGLGVISGTIGIVYAHELMHQSNRLERWLGDILMAMALYGHFRSEHLLVHHRYVGTPRDAVTAKYNENFHRFFFRVLRESLTSAWKAEKAMLARKSLPALHKSNPFWRYAALQVAFLALAFVVGGWIGLMMFVYVALIAIWQLELVNYVEHYGLTRRHLGDGKYEPTRPHHSWNSAHKASNWLLINLQRHSDHHYKPSRRFPLLQTYSPDEAPQLPYGYPLTTLMALIPPMWRRTMNPKVRAWRKKFYPDIEDWSEYNRHATPMPR
ncbi:MAG: alkane 1-monooxygenase [Boseongicola sp.]|nr:alkane 1-monooxygenase [Boseongicola sp.]MDD9979703.1 alkane 1-monooxygenase [Boseongicola sp.]